MMISRFPFTPVAAAVLGLWIPFAHAQKSVATETTVTTLETVTVSADASTEGLTKPFVGGQVARGGRIGILGNQDIMDTPFSSTSYTSELIQDQQAQSVADVLRNDPSVRQARGFGNFQEVYIVRGLPVYSDDVSYNGLYGMLPRQYIAAEFFERVEVFRGASAFLNGAAPGGSGIGGAINLLPKRAPNEPLSRVGFGLQSGGQTSLSTDIARRFGPDQSTGIRLNAARRDGGTGIDQENKELSALSLGLDWHSRNVRISADVGYQDHKGTELQPSVTPSSSLPIPTAPDAKRNFAQPWTYTSEQDTFATLRAEFDINDDITAWAAGGLRRSKESNSLTSLSLINAAGDSLSSRFDNQRKENISTGEVGVRAKFSTGSVGHTISASAARYHGEERNAYAMSGALIANNLYAPYASSAPPANLYTGGKLSDPQLFNEVLTSSVAVADTLSFAQDTVLLTLGARSQTIEQISYAGYDGIETGSYKKSKVTPVAGIVFKATPKVSLYANYIEGLVKGSVAPTTANSQPVTNAGQVFAPYASKQKEIGAKYDGGKWGGGVAFFTTTQASAFVQNQTYGLNGEQRNQGLEFSLYGEPLKGLRLLGGVTLINAEQTQMEGGMTNGRDAIGVPRQQLNLNAEWDVAGVRGLALNARVLHTSSQYANAANTQVVPAWNRLDLGARYLMDIGSNRLLTLRGRLDNVLNTSYWASAGGFPGSNYLVLGAPRTLVVSGSIDF